VRVTIAGGTGLLGGALVRALRLESHDVTVLTRRPRREGEIAWNPADRSGAWTKTIREADAVINLAGASLATGRWTAARKRQILESRIQATDAIAGIIAEALRPPSVLLSASAIGIYGPHGDELLTEETPPGAAADARIRAASDAG